MKIPMEIREKGMIAMVTDVKTIPLDLIIHPGETLAEVLEKRGITCAELADRTGFPIIYISNVIVGKDNISEEFAKSLEQILEVSRSFWCNLQANYIAEIDRYRN